MPLELEQPIHDLQEKIEQLRMLGSDTEINISDEIARLEQQLKTLTRSIFSKLTPWQVTQVARHPQRPHTSHYINGIFTEFEELHGDRHYSNSPALIGGVARFNSIPVVVMGHEKGAKTKDKLYRNFGMARPEAYRKALRLMQMAEKFKMPIFTFIDTPGAYPGIDAEENNQSEAIARNLMMMSQIKTPIICTVIGEGGSGGALAIGVGDLIYMLQYSVYSVISPEGCASILWKSAERASDAAEAMGVTSDRAQALGLIDGVIQEPLGGAHRNMKTVFKRMQTLFADVLPGLMDLSAEELVKKRQEKFMRMGTVQS